VRAAPAAKSQRVADLPDPFAADILAGLDPVRLARRAGLAPDPWQARALRSRAARSLWNCCRQSG
jgi:hypothetical protein